MAIKVGNKEVANITVGSTPVKSVYKGSTKIWPSDPYITIWEDANGVTTNPNVDDAFINLVQTNDNSNRFRITYKYDVLPSATLDKFDNRYESYYRDPSQIYFVETGYDGPTLPPEGIINTIEVARTSNTAKGVNLLGFKAKIEVGNYTLLHSVVVRLHASNKGLLGIAGYTNGSTSDIPYVIKLTVYKVEQYK